MALAYALIHEENGSYGISFPDFPGCVSGGHSAEEAMQSGREALAFHVSGMIEDGDALPVLRDLDTLLGDSEFQADAHGAILITALPVDLPAKAVRLNISLDEKLLERIDEAVNAAGETRSGWIARASKMRLGNAATENVRLVERSELGLAQPPLRQQRGTRDNEGQFIGIRKAPKGRAKPGARPHKS